MKEDAFAIGGDDAAEGVDGLFVKSSCIDEVVDYSYFLLYLEGAEGLVTQVLRDGGDGIALVDGERDHGREGLVAAYEGDVRTVEGRDHGNIAALGFHDLFSHIGGGGMRDGVVDMQQIELVIDDHVDHGARQSRLVRRIVEERVGGHAHFVVEDVRIELVETHRLLIGDKMDLVTLVRQGLTEFGGQYATAAKCGITDDAYTHG